MDEKNILINKLPERQKNSHKFKNFKLQVTNYPLDYTTKKIMLI